MLRLLHETQRGAQQQPAVRGVMLQKQRATALRQRRQVGRWGRGGEGGGLHLVVERVIEAAVEREGVLDGEHAHGELEL